jgi:hypothetical protein
MSPLADAIYDILRRRTRKRDPRITYAELARQLRGRRARFEHITHRSREMYDALCEIGAACRALGLPPLPALVVRADARRPGDAYYHGMPMTYRGERIAAWRQDLDAVRTAKYPQRTS